MIKKARFIISIALIFSILVVGGNIFVKQFFNEKIVKVPNVIDKTKVEAIEILKQKGLSAKFNEEAKDDEIVKLQNPGADSSVKIGRAINLYFNNYEGKKIPNILGMPLIKAERILNGENIRIKRIDYYPSNLENDIVLSTYPDINEVVGSQGISLLVSINEINSNTIMPNIIGMTLEEAESILGEIGLKIDNISYVEDKTKELNKIIYTDPEPGSDLKESISIVLNKIDEENYNKKIDDIIKDNLKDIKNEESGNNVPSDKKD